MSKYIKLEDAEDKMYQLWEEDTDNKINSAYCFDDDRAIEALRSLPTIEVSEDCISREYLEEQLQQIEDITAMAHIDLGEDPYDETEEITMPISTVRKIFKNAPSVVPQVPSEDCISREDILKTVDDNVSQQYSDTYETYGLDLWALFVRIIKNAPSVVPSRTEGEWINKQEKYQMAECSNCKKVTMHEMWGDKLVYYDYCPNCGAKMKGAE